MYIIVYVCVSIYMCIVRIFNDIMIIICVFLTLPYIIQHTHTHTHSHSHTHDTIDLPSRYTEDSRVH